MRVLIAGNLANMGFEIALAMRKKNVDAKLLLPKFPAQSEDPKFLYPNLENTGYPEWLVRFDKSNKSIGWNNWKLQIIREMRSRNYDVIIAMTEYPIFAMFSGKPYAALSTGSDMRQLYFERSLKGLLYRLSYKKAKIIIWGEPDKLSLLEKLKVSKKSLFATAPRNVNISPQKIERGDLADKFIIFHPIAQDWELKQNKIFLHAYNKLCSIRDDVHLILSDRGPNIIEAKEILLNEKTRGKFQLIPFINFNSLQYYYNLSDVVVDQFAIGSIGMTSIEAMMYEKPILIKLNEELFKRCYKQIPGGIINVQTEEEIFEALNKLALDKSFRQRLGQKNKEWVEKYWNTDLLTDRYIDICNMLLKNR